MKTEIKNNWTHNEIERFYKIGTHTYTYRYDWASTRHLEMANANQCANQTPIMMNKFVEKINNFVIQNINIIKDKIKNVKNATRRCLIENIIFAQFLI